MSTSPITDWPCNIINLQNSLKSKQDNITILGGTNVTVSESATDVWAINSVGSGAGGAKYRNTDNNLVIDNSADTLNLSNHIYVADISCGNVSAKNLSIVDGITSANISCDVITAGVARIKRGNVSDALFIKSVLSDNTNRAAIRQLSNGKTFINSYGVALTLIKTEINTVNGKSTRTIGDITFFLMEQLSWATN